MLPLWPHGSWKDNAPDVNRLPKAFKGAEMAGVACPCFGLSGLAVAATLRRERRSDSQIAD